MHACNRAQDDHIYSPTRVGSNSQWRRLSSHARRIRTETTPGAVGAVGSAINRRYDRLEQQFRLNEAQDMETSTVVDIDGKNAATTPPLRLVVMSYG